MGIRILKKEMDMGKMVDELADKISEAGMFCQSGVDAYLKGNLDAFTASLTCIRDTEKQGDMLRRSIVDTLYRKILIPDLRADVLELLENMDSLLDQLKEVVSEIEIERPVISEEFQQDFRDLLKYTVETVEADLRSCRAFFSDIYSVADHIHKVSFWETETDKISTRLQRTIFARKDLNLGHKMQLRYFVKQIDQIADDAEDIADRLNIFVSKRVS